MKTLGIVLSCHRNPKKTRASKHGLTVFDLKVRHFPTKQIFVLDWPEYLKPGTPMRGPS